MGHAARHQPQAHKSFSQRMVKEEQSYCFEMEKSQSPYLNPIKMLWKDIGKQFIGGNPPTSQSLSGSVIRNGLKLCKTYQRLQETLPSVTTANGGHTRYWKQRFTYFCNMICNTGSLFSKNKWQRQHFYLTCLIRFSLSTFRTYMKIWWCFG